MEEQLARLREYGFDLDKIPLGKDQSSFMINLTGDADRPMVVANINGEKMPFYFSSGAGGKSHVPPNRWYPAAGIGSKDGWINKGVQKADDLFYGNKQLERIGMALDEVFANANADEFVEALPMVNNKGSNITKDFINAGQKFTDLTPDRKPIDPEAYKIAMNRLRTFASDKPLATPPAPPIPSAETPYTPQFAKQAQVVASESAVSPPAATAVKAMAVNPSPVVPKVPTSLLNYRINLPPAVAPSLGAVGSVVGMGLQGYGATRNNYYDKNYGFSDPYGLRPAWDFMFNLTGGAYEGKSISQSWNEMGKQVAEPEYQLRSPTTAVIYNALHGNLDPARGFVQGVQDAYAPMWQKLNSPYEGYQGSMMQSSNPVLPSANGNVARGIAQGVRDAYGNVTEGFAQGMKDTYAPMWQRFTKEDTGYKSMMSK